MTANGTRNTKFGGSLRAGTIYLSFSLIATLNGTTTTAIITNTIITATAITTTFTAITTIDSIIAAAQLSHIAFCWNTAV